MLSSVKNKIEIIKTEIEGKQEQITVLPEKKKELKELLIGIEAEQKSLSENEKKLAETEKQVLNLDKQEKEANSLKTEIQVLENRVRDGKGKISDQEKRVKEAEKALDLMEKSRPGKEAFEKADAGLKILREQEKQRRETEKDISGLEKESSALKQKADHEKKEVERTEKELLEEEQRLKEEQKNLTLDKSLGNAAARLPELKKEEEKLHLSKGSLKGRLEGLKEGKEKLSEGICPFFKEECRNIIGKTPKDVFTSRVNDLDKENLDIDKRLKQLNGEIKIAEDAVKKIDAIKLKTRELEKQFKTLAKKQENNNKRKEDINKIQKNLEEAEKKTRARKTDLEKYGKLDTEIAVAEKLKTENQAARDAFFTNEKDAKDLNNRRDSLSKMIKLMNDLTRDLDAKQKTHTKIEKEYDRNKHAEARLIKEKLVGDIATLKQKIGDLSKDRLRFENDIKKMEQIKKDIKEKLAKKKRYEEKEELVKFLRNRIFNNVSAQLSERFREEISLRADVIYRNIAETDEELFWGDKYQIVLRDMQDGEIRERTDDQLSGGQIMSAVVALRLALLQTIGARVAFFDEPTSNLDATRRANLAHAFRAIDIGREEVTEHWYDQLFLISHDVNFTEITDQIICIE